MDEGDGGTMSCVRWEDGLRILDRTGGVELSCAIVVGIAFSKVRCENGFYVENGNLLFDS